MTSSPATRTAARPESGGNGEVRPSVRSSGRGPARRAVISSSASICTSAFNVPSLDTGAICPSWRRYMVKEADSWAAAGIPRTAISTTTIGRNRFLFSVLPSTHNWRRVAEQRSVARSLAVSLEVRMPRTHPRKGLLSLMVKVTQKAGQDCPAFSNPALNLVVCQA